MIRDVKKHHIGEFEISMQEDILHRFRVQVRLIERYKDIGSTGWLNSHDADKVYYDFIENYVKLSKEEEHA